MRRTEKWRGQASGGECVGATFKTGKQKNERLFVLIACMSSLLKFMMFSAHFLFLCSFVSCLYNYLHSLHPPPPPPHPLFKVEDHDPLPHCSKCNIASPQIWLTKKSTLILNSHADERAHKIQQYNHFQTFRIIGCVNLSEQYIFQLLIHKQ